ncbi:MAG: acyl-ACP--UDP-N-acetylglucosamine O-acyltransferase [Proteobacteria bacterium]|nr:acyl-ACP--UDP-N-acetylglucosamine O-acyltransferase [Pseudomonadota bacterium]
MTIHQTAIIEKGAVVPKSCNIGPYCIIGANVKLGDNVRLHSHVVISGYTEIGDGTEVFPFASIGSKTQDLKYSEGVRSYVKIGKNNVIREYVTINPGTDANAITEVKDHCLLMIGVHIAHDCSVGNHVIMANNCSLAGHVIIEDHAILGGFSIYHQFIRVGSYSIVGGGSTVVDNVIPYGNIMGDRAYLAGLNLIGMKRRNLTSEEMRTMQKAFDELFDISSPVPIAERIEKAQNDYAANPRVMEIIDFMNADSKRALCMPKANK